eukprot:TRINITY_DN74274_c0_g1_i1.p1 TRINITY_DN74274_c0_g1~~TRINITY_DN74274_c0_g1_i1.p1  ORF type:complete len:289 (-),score=58.71 TRINITY_DN74274_c0_g1_i1:299-1111(-)
MADRADESLPKEHEAWKKLLTNLAALKGYPKLEELLSEKHKELLNIVDEAPDELPDENDERAKRWFHRKLKNKDCGKVRAKLCMKLVGTLRELADELISSTSPANAIDRVTEALTQGTKDEGPLVCCMLAKDLEGTRFEGHWISQDGKGKYRLGEDGMKVAVQVLDGKLLIHGYFEGSFLHPVRLPIVAFLAEHSSAAKKGASDDCDLFGSVGRGGRKAADDRSRSPRQSKEATAGLPPGWVKKESRSKPGVFYYANEAKGLTQFEKPTA